MSAVMKSLENYCNWDFNREVIVIGDLNWEDKSSWKQLKQATDSFNLTQIIDGSTRITNSSRMQIDLIFINMSDRIIKSYNLITGLSDHNLILMSRKVNGKNLWSEYGLHEDTKE